MPLGCRPTRTVFACFHRPRPASNTETLPLLATPVRESMRTGVSDDRACGSSLLGASPPQLLTYSRPAAGQIVYGATPTDTTCFSSPRVGLRSWTLFPRVDVTQRPSSHTTRPAGCGSLPTFGLPTSSGVAQRYVPSSWRSATRTCDCESLA